MLLYFELYFSVLVVFFLLLFPPLNIMEIIFIIPLLPGETQKGTSKEKDVRLSNIVAAKGIFF